MGIRKGDLVVEKGDSACLMIVERLDRKGFYFDRVDNGGGTLAGRWALKRYRKATDRDIRKFLNIEIKNGVRWYHVNKVAKYYEKI